MGPAVKEELVGSGRGRVCGDEETTVVEEVTEVMGAAEAAQNP
jgi:hypothetical protein